MEDVSCLSEDHLQKDCKLIDKKRLNCQFSRHDIVICIEYMLKRKESSFTSSNKKGSGTSGEGDKGTFLQTFLCTAMNPKSAYLSLILRGIFDSGSLKSYISEKAFLKLKLSVESSKEISCLCFGSSDMTIIVEIIRLNCVITNLWVGFTSSQLPVGIFSCVLILLLSKVFCQNI